MSGQWSDNILVLPNDHPLHRDLPVDGCDCPGLLAGRQALPGGGHLSDPLVLGVDDLVQPGDFCLQAFHTLSRGLTFELEMENNLHYYNVAVQREKTEGKD